MLTMDDFYNLFFQKYDNPKKSPQLFWKRLKLFFLEIIHIFTLTKILFTRIFVYHWLSLKASLKKRI